MTRRRIQTPKFVTQGSTLLTKVRQRSFYVWLRDHCASAYGYQLAKRLMKSDPNSQVIGLRIAPNKASNAKMWTKMPGAP